MIARARGTRWPFNGRLLSSSSSIHRESEVSRKLLAVQEPLSSKRVTSLGCVKGIKVDAGGNVALELDLIVPGYPHAEQLKDLCKESIKQLDWVKGVSITTTVGRSVASADPSKAALARIKHIIGISSCKGGVGKSTVAVNLACALAERGLAVGLLDADIYGPSLPFQLEADSLTVHRSPSNPQHILPLTSKQFPNLRMLSFGHVNPKSGAPGSGGQSAALVRGPIATKIINQLVLATDWGELDYLLVDMPPGTGDIQITLSQVAAFSGAVMVTTPHVLALVDAVKGMALFQAVDIPTLAVVENMSYFRCDHGSTYYPFGKGGQAQVLRALRTLEGSDGKGSHDAMHEQLRRASFHSLPLTVPTEPADQQDESLEMLPAMHPPVMISAPDGEVAGKYRAIASSIIESVFTLQADVSMIPSVQWDKAREGLRLRYFTPTQAFEYFVPQAVLEGADAKTGEILADSSERATRNNPVLQTELKGQYGLAIIWRHQTKIFPFEVLKHIAEAISETSKPNR